MARKVSTDKIKEKMIKLKEKITKNQEETANLQSRYDELANELKRIQAEELLQFMDEHALSMETIIEQFTKKEEG